MSWSGWSISGELAIPKSLRHARYDRMEPRTLDRGLELQACLVEVFQQKGCLPPHWPV